MFGMYDILGDDMKVYNKLHNTTYSINHIMYSITYIWVCVMYIYDRIIL